MSTAKSKITQEEISKKVRAIIVDKFCVDNKEVTPEAKFIDDLGGDSLDFVEFSMDMEKEFNLQFKDEDLEKIVTVQDLITLINKMINE